MARTSNFRLDERSLPQKGNPPSYIMATASPAIAPGARLPREHAYVGRRVLARYGIVHEIWGNKRDVCAHNASPRARSAGSTGRDTPVGDATVRYRETGGEISWRCSCKLSEVCWGIPGSSKPDGKVEDAERADLHCF